MKKQEFKLVLYQRAKEQGSWATLIPYPSLLFAWQNEAQKRNDMKTVRVISAISSHKLGFQCAAICKGPFSSGHGHHNFCKPDCIKINTFMRKSLTKQLIQALKVKIDSGQQLLLDKR